MSTKSPVFKGVFESHKPKPAIEAPNIRGPRLYVPGRPSSEMTVGDRARNGLATPSSVEVVTTDAQLRAACDYIRKVGHTGFDTETTGLNRYTDKIVLVQLGDRNKQFVVWHDYVDTSLITALLEDASIIKYGVNLKFDLSFWFVKHGLEIDAQRMVDAYLVEQIITCGIYPSTGQAMKMSSLFSMVKHYFGIELDKDEDLRTGWGEYTPATLPQEKLLYAADDVVWPEKIAELQKPWIQYLGLAKTVKLETTFLPVLARMEARGLPLDWDTWAALAEDAQLRAKVAEGKLDALFDVTKTLTIDAKGNVEVSRDKNYASNAQLKDLIRDWMIKHENVNVIFTNKHFKEALLSSGRVSENHIDMLFREYKIPNPEKPGKMKKVNRPDGDDIVNDPNKFDFYKGFLPPNTFVCPDTESDTLKLMEIIYNTPDDDVDPDLPTCIGMPPALVGPILNLREANKQFGTYGLNWEKYIDPDGRVRTTFSQCALATGRLSSRPNCYDSETEILTESGWMKFKDLSSEDKVAQYDPATTEIEFVRPLGIVAQDYVGPMHHFESQSTEALVTPNHRMLVEDPQRGTISVIEAAAMGPGKNQFHAGKYVGGKEAFDHAFLRMIMTMQAITDTDDIDLGNTKAKKAVRLDKVFVSHSHLSDFTSECQKTVLDALLHWRGSPDRERYYNTNSRLNADMIQALLVLNGHRANISPYVTSTGNINWQVDVVKRAGSLTTNMRHTIEQYDGKIYCVTVPTGFVVVRRADRNGRVKVLVSGNTQNLPAIKGYRGAFKARPGYKMIAGDWNQAEPRVTAHFTQDPTYQRTFWSERPNTDGFYRWCGDIEDYDGPLDLYTEIGKACGLIPMDYTVKDTKGPAAKPDGKAGRQDSKITDLSLIYGTGKAKFFVGLMVFTQMNRFRENTDDLWFRFWEKLKPIKQALDVVSNLADHEKSRRFLWHPHVNGPVTWAESLGGRKRFFSSSALGFWTASRNTVIQATSGGDMLKEAHYRLDRYCLDNKIDGGVVNSIHDELLCEVATHQVEQVRDAMVRIMREVGEQYCPSVPWASSALINDYWEKD